MLIVSTPVRPSGRQLELAHGEQRAAVVEVGGGLRTYRAGERDVVDGYDEWEMCTAGRGQPLIPWPNRLRDGSYEFDGERHQLALSEPPTHNAIHGLTRWSNWTVAERERDYARMEHVLHPQTGYPFALALAIEYALGDSGLTVRTSATNVGARACPYGTGAHPYLAAGDELVDACMLQAPGAQRLRTDDRSLPTGTEPVDDTEYDFRSPRQIGATQLDTGYATLVRDADGLARVRLSRPDGVQVTLWQDRHYEYLMLFTGETVPEPQRRRRGLAVEPMTCAPNAFQSGDGLRVLAPGETLTSAWGIEPG